MQYSALNIYSISLQGSEIEDVVVLRDGHHSCLGAFEDHHHGGIALSSESSAIDKCKASETNGLEHQASNTEKLIGQITSN